MERNNTSAGQSALIEIRSPAAVIDMGTFPAKGAAFAPYLAETTFIKPGDPKIMAVAKEVTAGMQNAKEAVTALSQ